eukprot:9664038-Alexandrium_andersonii.AAC.1
MIDVAESCWVLLEAVRGCLTLFKLMDGSAARLPSALSCLDLIGNAWGALSCPSVIEVGWCCVGLLRPKMLDDI